MSVAPKERINAKSVPGTGDRQAEAELPLKMVILGDFTARPDETGLEERKAVSIDKNSSCSVMAQMNPPVRAIAKLRVRMGSGPCNTAILAPGIEFGMALGLRSRHEEPPPDNADLVLDLSLRQRARTDGATQAQSQPEAGVQGHSLRRHWFKPKGRRLDQIVPAHLPE
ncbi:hypothetical protein DVR11_20830 [Paracoccus versutus]|nr:hypothetical protein DVR11_20830 [Paracoccus versutus]